MPMVKRESLTGQDGTAFKGPGDRSFSDLRASCEWLSAPLSSLARNLGSACRFRAVTRFCLAVLLTFSAAQQASLQAAEAEPSSLGSAAVSLEIPNVRLLDQDGREVEFYSDLIKDRVVVISFIYTTCSTVCPVVAVHVAELQKLAAERSDIDSDFVSVSIDPVVDKHWVLKTWSQEFGPGPRWTFVTGDARRVERLLKALDVFTATKKDHQTVFLIGNDARGKWLRTVGQPTVDQLADMIVKVSR